MSQPSAVPENPTGSRFGWPKPARVEELKKLSADSKETFRLEFQDRLQAFPVVRVAIDLPKYRMANGRTASLQPEYMALHPEARADLFTGDPELWDAQEAQHNLLLKLAKQSDLKAFFEDVSNKQVDPILVDEHGFVVNGNRRLSTWRELYHQNATKYAHFRNIDVAVLPHCEEREIDRLEATLQIQKDIKADYVWHAEANMMLAKQRRYGFSNKDLAELYKRKESDIAELIDMRSYADEYLTSRGKKDHWSDVSDEFAFRKIAQLRKKLISVHKQEAFKHLAFALIDRPEEVGGRLYDAVPKLFEHLDDVIVKVNGTLGLTDTANMDAALEELLGGGATGGTSSEGMAISTALSDSKSIDDARKVVLETLETQELLKKNSRDADFLLECCSKAHSALRTAVGKGLRPESNRQGVAEQLDEIAALSLKIRQWLDENAQA